MLSYLNLTLSNKLTAEGAVPHLQSCHCNSSAGDLGQCYSMVSHLTPLILPSLSAWLEEHSDDVCDAEASPGTDHCDQCQSELGVRIDQLGESPWLEIQRNYTHDHVCVDQARTTLRKQSFLGNAGLRE